MSHLTCTNCLQKSPAEATRCKHCGRSFGPPPPRGGATGSFRRVISAVVLVAVATLVVVGAWQWWPILRVTRAIAAPETTAVTPPPTPAPESRAASVESMIPAPRPPARPPKDSAARVAEIAPARDSTRPAPPLAPAEPVRIDPAHQRYAQVWVKLRAEPNNAAAVLRVLQPGEVVTVDSLQNGWYRVVGDEQQVGYVDRQYLDTLPPTNP